MTLNSDKPWCSWSIAMRERDALEVQLESLGRRVEAFTSLSERAGRTAGTSHA